MKDEPTNTDNSEAGEEDFDLPEMMFDDSEMSEEMLAAVAMWDLAKTGWPRSEE
jgi:hypothetical protein